ncbi:MAG: hypothetical protein H7Y31_04150 [Chitinophagaceae bacterium]|nr:hypothetical protein [Chitinophagaceae bacterium]
MKKVVTLVTGLVLFVGLYAQRDTTQPVSRTKRDWSKVNVANRPKDHFLLQLGYNSWTKAPDSLQFSGIPLSYNFYFLMDFPFKTNPRYSVAIGAGIATDNMTFENTSIDITGSRADRLSFTDVGDTNHFKKYKLINTYLEAPVELRFSSDPEQNMKSWKGAIGVKVGTMIGAGTRGKSLVNSAGNSVNNYVLKERAKRYFNSTRLSVMGRFGYGIFSIYASYQINAFIKEGAGPDVRPLQVGLTISGL